MRFGLPALVLALLVPSALAQHPGVSPNEAGGVQTRRGNESPASGISSGQTNSRIDDDFNQDEQINITPDSGVVKVLRTNQKNLINDFVTAQFKLEHVVPRELRNVMRAVVGHEGGRAEVIRDLDKGEAYLQVICPKFMLPWIEDAVRRLDVDWLQQGRDGSVTGQYFSKYRPAETLEPFAVRYGGEGSTAFDPNLNAIARRDEPFRTKKYLEACALFDLPPPQALLRFSIYEVDTTDDLKLGVDWIAWKNGPGRALFEAIFAGQEAHHQYENASGFLDPNLGAFGLFDSGSHGAHFESTQFLLSANYVLTTAYLDFLKVKGKARVLARPEIFTFTHQPATWRSSDQFLAFEVTPDDPGSAGLVPARLNTEDASGNRVAAFSNFDPPPDFAAHNRFLNHRVRGELGLELQVFAAVGTESSEVDVAITSTELAGTTPQGTPIITSRRMVSRLRLADGQALVFGGMTRDEKIETSNKAPWLGDIPVLGLLFGQETSSSRRKELLFSVVPHFFQGAPTEVTDSILVDTMELSAGAKEIELPADSFGFDQWLFR
ncbi:MAG: hypothetical protein V2A76_08870 [Planctomycetota bacterium]